MNRYDLIVILPILFGIISVISFALFVFYFVIYRILERSTDKTETATGYYEKMKNVTGGKKIHSGSVNGWNITNYAIYKYTVNGKTYYQKWDATYCQKAPRQKPITYVKRFPRIAKVERKNRYYEKFLFSMAISIIALALSLAVIFA